MFLSHQKVEDLLLGVTLSIPTSNYREMVQLFLLNGQITFGHLQEEILKSTTANQLIPLFERQDLVHLLKLGQSLIRELQGPRDTMATHAPNFVV
jgi:hypothetical protein